MVREFKSPPRLQFIDSARGDIMKQRSTIILFLVTLVISSGVAVYVIVSPYAREHPKKWGFLLERAYIPVWEVWVWEFQGAAALVFGAVAFFQSRINKRKIEDLEKR